MEQKLHNASRLCYEIENFTENTFLSKIIKFRFVSTFVVNEFFRSGYLTGESFLTCLGLLAARFISVYKIKCFLVNISK